MKKSLIALATLAAVSGTAMAQSTVTMYGIVELGVDMGFKDTTTVVTRNAATLAATNTVTTTVKPGFRVQDGNSQGQGTSRIGWRGTEDLGGGLTANYQLEMGLRADDGCAQSGAANCTNSGNSGGQLFGRNAWAGLKGGFGEVRLGRQVLGSFSVQGSSWAGGASNGLYDSGVFVTPAMGGVRFSDAVRYLSPTVGGITVTAAIAAPEATTTDTTTPAGVASSVVSAKPKTGFDLTAEYAAGPLYLGLGYNTRGGASSTAPLGVVNVSARNKIDAWTLGGSYDLGVARVFANWTEQKTTTNALAATALTTNGTEKHRAWSIGAHVPMGAATLLAAYGKGDIEGTGLTTNAAGAGVSNANLDADLKAFNIGVRYALSKRTTLQANYGVFDNERVARTATIAGAVVTPATNSLTDGKIRGLNVGLRHTF